MTAEHKANQARIEQKVITRVKRDTSTRETILEGGREYAKKRKETHKERIAEVSTVAQHALAGSMLMHL
jgi:hypothetical protein